jgi:hypothetical protein
MHRALLGRKLEEKRQLGSPRNTWENNIKHDVKEMMQE